ncbi:MAG: 3-carboxy-cis,cis-muconate cycloisomerase [Solirubrobacterales bacterium]|nr:3-carboxy-cis,cis-muconate cycloisomerase [Solirubrobacterales bacterium]
MSAHGILSGLFSRGPVADEVSDRALLSAMVEVEVALLRALGRAGLAPLSAGDELAAATAGASLDPTLLAEGTAAQGTPVPALVKALRTHVCDGVAAHLHQGATSQDIVDTAIMLVAQRALRSIERQIAQAGDSCARLAEHHREALIPGRTLLQQALPVTFGLKAAGWLSGLDQTRAELLEVHDHVLAVQLGGAVGTLAAFGEHGLEIVADVARQLGLSEPELPWHTLRLRPARLAAALGAALGMMGKIARDVVLLAQTEVAEASERAGDGRGASSAMPQKQNPVGSVAVLACAHRGPGLVATILSAMVQEHERAAGAWQAEWEPLLELLRLTGSAAASLNEVLEGLSVNQGKMTEDLGTTGDLLMSESVAVALAPSIGRPAAQDLVASAARRSSQEGRSFREVLLESHEVADSLGPSGLEQALDPRRYLGVAQALIDRALVAHREHAER